LLETNIFGYIRVIITNLLNEIATSDYKQRC